LTKTISVNILDGFLDLYFTSLSRDGGVRHPIISAISISGITRSQPNLAPIVTAGEDQTIELPETSTVIYGTATDSEGNQLTNYLWTQEEGPNTVVMSGETTSVLN
ncbi:hypothetical protein, partial [Flavobacterium sp. ASW18X]|uniref:PKD domain-containing protein n=1 Tax=Flavobacterium sp. ASW18X TaxID=2572595 RepID=UPI00197A9812